MKQKECLITLVAIAFLLSTLLAVPAYAQSGTIPTAKIDVFTNRGGLGANVSSGGYGPLELVSMYANVTFGDTALANQDVAFYVENSNGSTVTTRVATTNETGIAMAQYRLPLPDQNLSETGTWSIVGVVNVAQTTLSDKTTFTFSYLSEISNVQVPPTISPGQDVPIQISINNMDNSTAWSELDLTIFDQAQTPIAYYTTTNDQPTQNQTVSLTINVPTWAFTGQATVCVCLLSADGTALAPETNVNMQILPDSLGELMNPFSTPEYAWGGLIALLASFLAFVSFEVFKRKRQKKRQKREGNNYTIVRLQEKRAVE